MIDPKAKEVLEQINSTPYGKALQEFLDDQLTELNDVTKCTSWDDTLGRKYAVGVIENLFNLIKVKKTPPQNNKNNYV
jgi:hypothetical protein